MKYGAQFRAMAGGVPLAKPAAAPPAPPAANVQCPTGNVQQGNKDTDSQIPVGKSLLNVENSAGGNAASKASAWAALKNVIPEDFTKEKTEKIWFDFISDIGVDESAFTAEHWALVEKAAREWLPF